MDKLENNLSAKEYRRFSICMAAGAVISVIFVILFSQVITRITARMTYDTALAVKETMLKENVENLIAYLDVCADAYQEENPEATAADVEEEVRQIAYRKIYSEIHADGTYMWVQKVLNYDGGDDYAIRLIHPNLSDTEGSYLSTNTLNPSGIRAYEEELNGVKENGSVYLTYEFKKLDSDEVTKKVTYSSLYKRFDWIVCMGVNIDDLTHYQDEAKKNMAIAQTLTLLASSIVWLVLLALMLQIYMRTNGRAFARRNKELRDQLDWDVVSRAASRANGQKLLNQAFESFVLGERYILVLMLDIDFFKQFNDNYGHDLGDKVLKSFAEAVKKNMSERDSIIRWGGDEFVAILYGIEPKDQPLAGDRILESIRSIELKKLKGERMITASMGFSYINDSDQDIQDALERADAAVYEAKENGRNNWKIK